MAGYPSGTYGIEKRNWMRIWLGVVGGILGVIVLLGAYMLLHRSTPAVAQAAIKDVSGDGAKTPDANAQIATVVAQVMASLNAGPSKIIEARDKFNDILPMSMGAQQKRFIKEQLSKLADEWLFGGRVYPGDKLCSLYKVESGDHLTKIGSQHKVPYQILLDINKMSSPQQLRADETIKVINGPFHAKVSRSTYTLDLYLQNTFVKSFTVGIGKPGKETPTGLWVVKSDGKMISPTWTDPDTGKTYKAGDADYPLGSRWIALKGIEGAAVGRTGFAIHGTKDPNQIGRAVSRGCIRMYNDDAVKMYNLLAPGVSQVQVMD